MNKLKQYNLIHVNGYYTVCVCAVTIELLSYVITSCSFYSSKSTYIDKNSHLK